MYITCTVKIVTDTAYTLKSRLEHGKFHSLIRCEELLYTRVIFALLRLQFWLNYLEFAQTCTVDLKRNLNSPSFKFAH